MRVEYHPQAASDLNSAVDHYNGLRPGLGDALRLEVYTAISRCSNPQRHREIEGGMRRCFVHRFPYSVLFRCPAPDVVSVHTLRNWEQGRRHPEGPAIALLCIAARHPRIIRENVGNVAA